MYSTHTAVHVNGFPCIVPRVMSEGGFRSHRALYTWAGVGWVGICPVGCSRQFSWVPLSPWAHGSTCTP